jgi:hypothetical protein
MLLLPSGRLRDFRKIPSLLEQTTMEKSFMAENSSSVVRTTNINSVATSIVNVSMRLLRFFMQDEMHVANSFGSVEMIEWCNIGSELERITSVL